MDLTINNAGNPVDFSSPSIVTIHSIAALRFSADLIEPRLRGRILPPILIGDVVPAGDALLWLTDTNKLGFRFGTALAMPSVGSVRGLFQDSLERTFSQEHRIRLDNQLFVFKEGINYFVGDEVLVRIHRVNGRQPGVVTEILDSPPDTVRVQLNDGSGTVDSSIRHIVLTGPGLEIPEVQANHNTSPGFSPGDLPPEVVEPNWRTFTEDQWRGFTEDQWRGFKE
jgi:hypothetical protein